jgi:small-conductance mechanosensitive channel
MILERLPVIEGWELPISLAGALVVLFVFVPLLRALKRHNLRGIGLLTMSTLVLFFATPPFLYHWMKFGIASDDLSGKVALSFILVFASAAVFVLIERLIESPFVVNQLQLRVPAIFLNLVMYLLVMVVVVIVAEKLWAIRALTGVITASAAGSVIAGFALKDPLSGFFSGIALVSERTFKIGDWVKMNEVEGEVLEITWRAVRLRTRTGDVVVVPHTTVHNGTFVNYSKPTREHAVYAHVGLSYDLPPSRAKQALLDAVSGVDKVLATPKPSSGIESYGDFSINYFVKYWIDDYERLRQIHSDVLSNIWYGLRRRGISIPFPIQDLYLHRPTVAPTADLLSVLRAIPIFKGLSDGEVAQLKEAAHVRDYGAGEALMRQGESGDSLFSILEGKVDVMIRHQESHRIVATLGPTQFVGEMALLTGEPRTATVVAKADVTVLEVGRDALRPILQANPETAESIARVMALRKEGLDEARANVLADHERQRLAQKQRGFMDAISKFFGLRG